MALVFFAVDFFAVDFLALPALATFLREAGFEEDFRVAVFFMVFLALVFFAVNFFAVDFLALPALTTFLREAVVSADALTDALGGVPLTRLNVCPATIPPPRI